MFELRHVSKSYGGPAAVHDLDLHLGPATTTALIGPSGCGKSTVLRLLLGLVTPDAGTVSFDGRALDAVGPDRDREWLDVRRRVGYVVQGGGLFPHRRARGNITMVARELGWDDQAIGDRLEVLAASTHFPPDALDRYPHQLSGGQRQRVALMRALMLDPDVLLLDEPLGALDPMIRYELQEELRAVFRQLGKTVLLVTHDLAEAAFFGDRIVLMRAGEVVQAGTLADFVEHPAVPFVREFVTAQRGLAVGVASP